MLKKYFSLQKALPGLRELAPPQQQITYSLRKKFVGQIAYFGGLLYLSERCIVNQGNWKISSNREDSNITLDALSQSRVFVIGGPREKFTEHEINHLKKYLETGGSILVLLGRWNTLQQVCNHFGAFPA